MESKIQELLYWSLQRLLLRVPKLSEGRLATSRVLSFLRAWHYLSRSGVRGDYLEFGVFEGMSFDLSLRTAAKFINKSESDSPRFFAFDSFEGLPDPDPDQDTQVFRKGEYSAPQEKFERNIRHASKGWEVHKVVGFFNETLTLELLDEYEIKKAAFVNIDCDLYPSTKDVLLFITPILQTGAILYFDDWYFSGGDMTLGEAGACHEWLKDNPEVRLIDYGDAGIMGKMFIVNRRAS